MKITFRNVKTSERLVLWFTKLDDNESVLRLALRRINVVEFFLRANLNGGAVVVKVEKEF